MKNTIIIPPALRSLDLPCPPKVLSYLQGLYESQHTGSGLEFSELREYSFGDEVRSIDWKASARQQKTYVRRYVDRRNQNIIIALDGSSSMALFDTKVEHSSLYIAGNITSIIMRLAQSRGDHISFFTLDKKQGFLTPTVSRRSQISSWFLRTYNLVSESKNSQLDWLLFLEELRLYISKPSLIVILSDAFESSPQTIFKYNLLKAAGHKVWCIRTNGEQISIGSSGLGFRDIETGELMSSELLDKTLYHDLKKQQEASDANTNLTLKKHGIPIDTVNSSSEVIPSLIRILTEFKRGSRK